MRTTSEALSEACSSLYCTATVSTPAFSGLHVLKKQLHHQSRAISTLFSLIKTRLKEKCPTIIVSAINLICDLGKLSYSTISHLNSEQVLHSSSKHLALTRII